MVYFTTDGKRDFELTCGITPPNMFGTVDFRATDNEEEVLARLREHQQTGPLVNSELYAGKSDWCGQPYIVTGI